MKQIKIFVAVAVMALLAVSCYQREFVPAVGEVEVEFTTDIDTMSLTSVLYDLPVQMVTKSETGALAVMEFVEGTIVMPDGTTRAVVNFTNDEEGYANGGDILITDTQVYIRGWDPEDPDQQDEGYIPSSHFEIRIPEYNSMQSITLKFRLVGQYTNPSGVNETTLFITK